MTRKRDGVCAACRRDHVGPDHFHLQSHRDQVAIVERREERERRERERAEQPR